MTDSFLLPNVNTETSFLGDIDCKSDMTMQLRFDDGRQYHSIYPVSSETSCSLTDMGPGTEYARTIDLQNDAQLCGVYKVQSPEWSDGLADSVLSLGLRVPGMGVGGGWSVGLGDSVLSLLVQTET